MPFDLDAVIGARSAQKVELFERYVNPQMVRVLKTIGFDINYVRGEGPYLFDDGDRRYLDLLSGFGVFALGRNHPTIVRALRQAMDAQLAGLVQLDVSLLAGLLAEALLKRMPWLDKVFFCSSGAEAVEAAIKFARAATRRPGIVYCDHAFHGLTYGALSCCGDQVFRDRFGPFVGDCREIPFNDPNALERALAGRDVAAFIVEPIQGKGVNLPDPGYLAIAARLCAERGTLFVADEIQTGLGRTGRFLACDHQCVEPDLVLLAKALSGGFVPVGAVAMRNDVFERVFNRMDRAVVHGSTFAKNDLAMAAGLATLATIDDEGLIQHAAALGDELRQRLAAELEGLEFVREVRGAGLMLAVEFGSPRSLRLKTAYNLLEQANKGLFCQLVLIPLLTRHRILTQVAGPAMPVVKLLPPLVITRADVDWIVGAFRQVIAECGSLGGVWDLGRTLAAHALKSRAAA